MFNVKRKKIYLMISIVVMLALVLTLTLSACEPNPTDVSFTSYDNVRYKDFSIEDSYIVISFKDGSSETIEVTKDMLSAEDLAKLKTPGKHEITINYEKKKSITVLINILRDTEKDIVINKIIQGLQKTAPSNNINGSIKVSAYYEIAGQPRKDYSVSLNFTLDIDQGEGAENYLGLEITEDSSVLLGIYYKDDILNRPNIYIKSSGPFASMMGETQNKFRSVSVDEYFGEAEVPTEEHLLTLNSILQLLDPYVENDGIDNVVDLVLSMLLTDAAIADDGSFATMNVNLDNILGWLPALLLMPGAANTANSFLSSINAGFTFEEALDGGIAKPPLIRVKSIFSPNGAIQSLDLTDLSNNGLINKLLSLNLPGKIDAGINIEKFSIKADSTSFSLPIDKGIEEWEESEVSFERWVLLQYRRTLGEPVKPASRAGIKEYLDIDYVGDNDLYHKLDVYRPVSREGEKLPVIINIHGGGWVHGSKEGVFSYCQYLALQGFVVVNINYHLLPTEVLPEPIQDIFAAFNFVMDEGNSEIYDFDTSNIFLTGDSAGGHYAMLALSVLVDPSLSEIYDVQSNINFKAVGVSSTGFTFKEVIKLPIPFAHFYVNQFFSDELPYTAYRDDPRYIEMAKSLNLENNKIENFPPMFVSSAHGDLFKVHSERLVQELEDHGINYVYDYRDIGNADNPENFFLGHDFNINIPDWQISKAVNNYMCDFFKAQILG